MTLKIAEIPVGEVFTIGETLSYPKLRTNEGYVDMRDKIKIPESRFTDENNARVIDAQEITNHFKDNLHEIKEWIEDIKKEFIPN